MQYSAVLIAGPTASGKSALALQLAAAMNGTVVNADAMQVYRELLVLTARPSAADEAFAPHRLYGHVAAATRYSVGAWLADLAPVLDEARAADHVPILVGGTGLYFKAAIEGLVELPEIPAETRESLKEKAGTLGPTGLYDLLVARDPVMAKRLPPSDPQRIIRALEVLEGTGRSLAEWQTASPAAPLIDPAMARKIVLDPDREVLRERIAQRFYAMVEAGALDEVERLAALRLDPELPAMKAIGV
ncbi:MAG: tRNA (adenosine(37)-N6)-dimethylallyltransferase MiaA, partial [Hyphomicrobiales bacterium]|nr:tRNA (adenosine(37)-N6)-dimethylallyltransferase MiaA [Hyphomicrobiales bacterium]